MAEKILIPHDRLSVDFEITDDRELVLLSFSSKKEQERFAQPAIPKEKQHTFRALEIQCTGDNCPVHHGYKHHATQTGSSLTYEFRKQYQNYWGTKLEVTLSAPNGLEAVYHVQFFNEISMIRCWCVVTNKSEEDIGLEYLSSFHYEGLCQRGKLPFWEKTDLYLSYHTWYGENQWKKYPIKDLGFSGMLSQGYGAPGFGVNRFQYGNYGSWSTCEHLPMGILSDRETGETFFWQIESSCGWLGEYGQSETGGLYLSLSGPTEAESHWWKNLKPGQSFTTVTAAFGAVNGSLSDAAAELTKYRRTIRRPNQDDEKLNIVFNDYMNCLSGDPTAEKEYAIIDKAALLGCEYYCVDAGWYDDGPWWDRVGEWKESKRRFPDGLKKVFDYIREKGMKGGMWLEIEVMGISCPLASSLPDDWFFMRHGKRHADHGRYLLDFRNPAVREYATQTVERLIDEYGVSFFKIDYNVTTGIGTDLHADSPGDGLLEHVRCLYGWYRDLYQKYPDLVIESCSSGGQRMDYGLLQGQSLQSISDQTDYLFNALIAANTAFAVAPEQAGMWVYPYEDDREHVIFNLLNGILLRPYISGQVWGLSEENLALMKEGISLYKKIRPELRQGLPLFPLGFASPDSPVLAYGIQYRDHIYLSLYGIQTDEVNLSLQNILHERKISSIEVLYPQSKDCVLHYTEDGVCVKLPQTKCARLLKVTLKDYH